MSATDFINIIRETDRLVIRPMREPDFETVYNGLKSQHSPKNKYDDEEIDSAAGYSENVCAIYVAKAIQSAEKDQAYLFRAFKKSDNTYVGGIIIKTIQRKNFQWAEIGYWLLNQHWGSAYGSEMVRSVIDIAFSELSFHRLEAHINIDNVASQKTAEKAGMEFECIRKGFIFEGGVWTDNLIYAITNTDCR